MSERERVREQLEQQSKGAPKGVRVCVCNSGRLKVAAAGWTLLTRLCDLKFGTVPTVSEFTFGTRQNSNHGERGETWAGSFNPKMCPTTTWPSSVTLFNDLHQSRF